MARGFTGVLIFALICLAAAETGQSQVSILTTKAGAAALPSMVIETYKLDEKNGVEIKWVKVAHPRAMQAQLAMGKVPVSSCVNPSVICRYRDEGRDIVSVYSAFLSNHYVVVKKGLPIQNLSQLKGKKIGIYGWEMGSIAALYTVAKKMYGLDLKKDMRVVVSSPPALMALLNKGEVVAISQIDPLASKLILDGVGQQLVSIGEEFQKMTGKPFLVTTIAANSDFARNNSQVMKRMIKTYQAAFVRIKDDPKIYKETGFIQQLAIEPTPEIQQFFAKRFSGLYINRFDQGMVEAVNESLKMFHEYGIMEKVCTDWYSLDYLP
jgi:ABC-type nitrate/sulfonate/bicarbonate transport system substrate-binding protein